MFHGVRVFAIRIGQGNLAVFLERAHAILVSRRGPTNQNHRPAVLLGVGETGKSVNDPRPGHDQTRLGAAGEIPGRLCRVTRRLLVAHADVGDACFLGGKRNAKHRKSDDAEHVVDTLLLEALRHYGGAINGGHCCLSLAELLTTKLSPDCRRIHYSRESSGNVRKKARQQRD